MADSVRLHETSVDAPKGGPLETFKQCSTCCEPIRTCAKKCNQCNSYQGVRRYFTASSAVLAVLFSLVATFVAAWPLVHQSWRADDSDLRVGASPQVQNGHIFLLVTNSGKRPASVDVVRLDLPIKEPSKVIWLHLMRKDASSAGVILSDSTKELDFSGEFPASQIKEGAWDPCSLADKQLKQEQAELNGSCHVTLQTVTYKGKPQNFDARLDCEQLKTVLWQYWHDANVLKGCPTTAKETPKAQ